MSSTSLTETVLKLLEDNEDEPLDTLRISSVVGEDHQKVIGAVNSLLTIDDLIQAETRINKVWELTDEGRHVSQNGKQIVSSFSYQPLQF